MASRREIRLGGVEVKSVDGRRFILQDVHAAHNVLMIEDADTAELILFLFKHSHKAKSELKIEKLIAT